MLALGSLSSPSEATSLRGIGPTPEGVQASLVERRDLGETIHRRTIHEHMRDKPATEAPCDKIKKDAVEILTEDLRTLGSSANRTYLPAILGIFKSNEIELRIAAADAIGMMGPQDQDVETLAPLANDPVPDVRRAVSQAISHGKGSAISLLRQRTTSMKMGLAPETPADAAKYSIPVAPDSTYLFYGSDPASGRLSYHKARTRQQGSSRQKPKRGRSNWMTFRRNTAISCKTSRKAREQIQEREDQATGTDQTGSNECQSVH